MEPILPYFSVAKEYQHIPSVLLDPFRMVGHFNLRSKKVASSFRKIEDEYKKKILGYEIEISAYIMELMVYFMRNDYINARRPATGGYGSFGKSQTCLDLHRRQFSKSY